MLRRGRMLMTRRERVPISYRSSATTTASTTVSKPSGAASGDLAVVVVPFCSTGITLTTTSGSAWSRSEITYLVFGYYAVLFWKILNGTDASNTWILSEANDAIASAWQPGSTPVTGVAVTTGANTSGQSTLALTGFTATDATKGAITAIADRDPDSTLTAPTNFTRRAFAAAMETYFTAATADYPNYQGGTVTWTNVNGAATYPEVGWLLHVS